MIVCRTLGPVEVLVDGAVAPADLLWRKNVALLVYLARSPKRARARDHLIGLLWGDKAEERARQSLNEALRTLRHYVGGALETDATQVRLVAGAVELDTDRLEALAAAGNYEAAAALVAGDFLEGFSIAGASRFDDWVAAERAGWCARSVDVLLHRIEQLLAGGTLAAAGDAAERALALAPTSDAAFRAVLRCVALSGDRAGALARFDAFAARLAAEVGTEPDAETKALAERVRSQRSLRLPTPEPGGSSERSVAETRRAPLVGRFAELTRLLDAWATCRREARVAVAVVEGDPGMGKTRLAEEVVGRARLDGAAVAVVRAVEADLREPWSGLRGLARGGVLEVPGVAGASPATLAALRGDWARVERPAPAFAEVLRAVAEEGPVMLVLDDATWCDAESLGALGACARDLEGTPTFLLATVAAHPPRPELDALRVRIGRELLGAAVRLAPLSSDALQTLAHWALPRYAGVDLDRVTRRVATDSACIPLLAVELLHAVALGLDLRESPGAWPEPLRTLDETLPGDLPDAVVAAVRIGFYRLSPNAREVLTVAAVLGGRVARPALARVTRLDAEPLTAALDELEWQRWLTAESRGYAFVARIVREVVARDMVTAGQRQRILDGGRPAS
ncbi:MAG TPA: AAA family ATPase [Gemmatimonadales bacterium]|nr:AAA family ATPase [Gemmatimonadales bacterium]